MLCGFAPRLVLLQSRTASSHVVRILGVHVSKRVHCSIHGSRAAKSGYISPPPSRGELKCYILNEGVDYTKSVREVDWSFLSPVHEKLSSKDSMNLLAFSALQKDQKRQNGVPLLSALQNGGGGGGCCASCQLLRKFTTLAVHDGAGLTKLPRRYAMVVRCCVEPETYAMPAHVSLILSRMDSWSLLSFVLSKRTSRNGYVRHPPRRVIYKLRSSSCFLFLFNTRLTLWSPKPYEISWIEIVSAPSRK